MRAVVYARISSEEQSVYSLDSQVNECRTFIERLGHECVDVYIDDGYSAKDLNRPRIQDLLEDLQERKFDLVVSWKLDRLTRDTVDGLTLIINLFKKKHGVVFMSATEDIKTETPDDVMMLTIRLSMAQAEREKIRERVTMGQIARAKSGRRNTPAKPYGYDVNEDLSLTINLDEAPIVRQIFEWFIDGYGREKIARILNQSKVPPPRGGELWFEATIKAIIVNPTFYGATHYRPKGKDRILFENTHEPIVSKETWIHANEVKKRRGEGATNLSSYNFAFSTVTKCGVCGRSYHGKLRSVPYRKKKLWQGEDYNYYRCSGKYRQRSCSASDIAEHVLLKMLFDVLEPSVSPFTEEQVSEKPALSSSRERKRITKELEKSKERLTKLAKAMASGNIDFEIYTELRNEEKVKVEELEEALRNLPDDAPPPPTRRLSDIADDLLNMSTHWTNWTPEKRKQVIQRTFKQIVINKVEGKWRIEMIELHE